MRHLFALLAATVALGAAATAAPAGQLGQIQLLPFGEFAARDGRPGPGQTWKIDDARGQALSAAINSIAAATPIVIDYDHATLTAMASGHRAPAAGWIKRTSWQAGKGLFAEVEWTAAAAGHIQAGEYRYISPVIAYDEAGQVTGLSMAALVNYPALLGMEPAVAALSAFSNHQPPRQEHSMDLAALLALLGLQANATPEQIRTHVTALSARPTTLMPTELQTALGLDKPDLQAALSAVQALKGGDQATMTAMTALQQQVAALSAELTTGKVSGLVDQAIADHKLLPAQRDWALDLGKKDLAQLTAFLSSAPVIAGLGGQSGGKEPGSGGTAALSGDQAAVAAQLGLDPTKFAEQLKAAA